ncbi:MAG: ATP-grasp domain-containing protein [Dehalococcoidia bacterium]|nr:ATP-grasp domain-containing protein [Dehalococcoidia bacterium]
MRPKIAIIYNAPNPDLYGTDVEKKASLTILDSVNAVYQALVESGYPAVRFPLLPPLESAKESLKQLETDIVFNLFEGFDGCPETEPDLTNFLDELGLTYTGCPANALSFGLDKIKTKARLAAMGTETPRYQMLDPKTTSLFHLSYPCIVKPYTEDGSNGISEESVVHDFASLERQVTTISRLFGKRVLVEEFIDGREFNTTVLGTNPPKALPISEIAYSLPPELPRILTFSAKWDPQSVYYRGTKAVCPAEVDTELQERITQTALLSFRLLGSRGYVRVDFRLDSEEKLKVIELNPNPDISPDAGAALQAKAAGLSYSQFIEQIVQLALPRKEK